MSEAPLVSGNLEPKGTVDDLREWTMTQSAVGRCLFCPDWEITGTVKEVEASAKEHRLAVHPDLKPQRRRARANLGRWRSYVSEEDSADINEERSKRLRLLGIEPENA